MARLPTGGIDRRDKVKIAVLAAAVLAIPAAIVLPWVHRHLEAFFSGARAQLFGQVLVAILLEAFPFVLIGATISGLVEVFLPPERLARLIPRRLPLRLLMAAGAGIILPVCECGIVPVARRLLRKGLPIEMAVVFMLAGPIVNPMVVASTAVAFVGQGLSLPMTVARVACGVTVAMLVGLAVYAWFGRGSARDAAPAADDAHTHSGCAEAHGRHGPDGAAGSVVANVLSHIVHDFLLLGGYLLLGSLLAAGLQAFMPRDLLVSVGKTPVLATAAMMLMAFLLNVCSEADAFLAAAFAQFSFAGRLGFLVFGPMLDVKLVAMYLGAFPKRMLLAVLLLVPPLCLTLSELAGWVVAMLMG
ncbi:MAG: permease [Planctomycetes bacterium]|nr:permease [Planctomycetota bacterium]